MMCQLGHILQKWIVMDCDHINFYALKTYTTDQWCRDDPSTSTCSFKGSQIAVREGQVISQLLANLVLHTVQPHC